jgi:hypothetical protein
MEMPVVRPVPIPTKGMPWYRRALQAFKPRRWELVKDFEYYSPTLRMSILIPAPFVFDGASVPRILWPFLDPVGLLLLGALPHDFGYRYRGLFVKYTHAYQFRYFTRSQLDEIMEVVVSEVNDMSGMAKVARIGVCAGGWVTWNKYRREDRSVFHDYPMGV